ncbi:hypothetical protein CTI12_AA092890 [Artemisia annua]|uniref:Uncharacterized protein n=1 Tax=Artemisia annua TaxID=35608 RepID=A0A2U1PZX7_ARTAN|nr:hypothetical protein CTI12_AA092890 [Artemisia annua]
MGERKTVWERPKLSPEVQRYVDMVWERTLANRDLVEAYFDKIDSLIQKYQEAAFKKVPRIGPPATVVYTPRTVIDTSAPTCATRGEAAIYALLASGDDPHSMDLKIINPATGVADEVFKEIVLNRYHGDLNKYSETAVAASYGIAHEELPGASVIKRFRKDVGQAREIIAADSSVSTTNGGSSAASGGN